VSGSLARRLLRRHGEDGRIRRVARRNARALMRKLERFAHEMPPTVRRVANLGRPRAAAPVNRWTRH